MFDDNKIFRIATKLSKKVVVPTTMKINNPKKLISRLWKEYEPDSKWDGNLYRVGDGSYYHISEEGAEFYTQGHVGDTVKSVKFPNVTSTVLIDLDNQGHADFLYKLMNVEDPSLVDDIGVLIEQSLPKFKELGFDSMIINGETGSGVEGPSIEFVLL